MPIPYEAHLAFAQLMDQQDALACYKSQFHFPEHNCKPVIYFCGNSLGLQPKTVAAAIEVELASWQTLGIEGYFTGTHPWLDYQRFLIPSLSALVGAKPEEVTVMNALTVNLHLMLFSFYRPTATRYKILMEAGAFPSDQYAIETQVKHYGFSSDDAIIEIAPRPGEKIIQEEDIIQVLQQQGSAIALVLLGGINYYTGQWLDMPSVTKAAHAVGAYAGWDLAHVVGNVPVELHQWEVDFAVWCSYKYLNGGPGAVGGAFVHEKHITNTALPRMAGWWGNEEQIRFKMEKGFVPKATAAGWNLSTTQVFNTVALKASLEMFAVVGIIALREKSVQLTGYLAFLLNQLPTGSFEIITPTADDKHGAQLCLYFQQQGKAIHEKMLDQGIVVDYREPGVIRVAPAPLYCSFEDVYRFYEIIRSFF